MIDTINMLSCFFSTDWSLQTWYTDNHLTPGSDLGSSDVSSLMEATECGEYLQSPMVIRDHPTGTYAASYLGWSSGNYLN